MSTLEQMVRRLYETRQAAASAKKALTELATTLGKCVGGGPEDSVCYLSRKSRDHWCDVCQAKQPMWEDYQIKSRAAGVALRAVLRAGKGLEIK